MMKASDLSQPAKLELEPGLLSIFRLILWVQSGLQILGLAFNYLKREEIFWGIVIDAGIMIVLLLYLYSERIQTNLNRFYLPLAIALYAIGAMIQRYIAILVFIRDQALLTTPAGGHIPPVIQDSRWSLLVALLVPLVITAWQYDLKRVLMFCVVTIIFEAPLILFAFSFDWMQSGEEILFVFVARTVLLTSVGYIVTRMIGAQRQQRNELALANAKLREHAATLEQLTISHERNRMARELHDTLAHSLSAVSVQLEAVDSAFESSPMDARRLLGKALAQTRSGLAETRRALQSLRASPLDDLGLKLAIENLATTTAKRGGMKLSLQMEDVTDLSATVEQDIYRVAQEAISNVLKHAHATRLEVSLGRRNGEVVLTIRDDGAGFAAEVVRGSGHFGLQGMMERAELIGATLSIESSPDKGATIRLAKPMM